MTRAIDGRLGNNSEHKKTRKNKIMTIAFGAVDAVATSINRIFFFFLDCDSRG